MKSDGDRIVAWTLCSRSFEGEPFLSRTMRLICGMYKRNWKPASSDLEKSQNYYRNGKHHEVLTTVWAKFSNP